jgi:hypothetical protein
LIYHTAKRRQAIFALHYHIVDRSWVPTKIIEATGVARAPTMLYEITSRTSTLFPFPIRDYAHVGGRHFPNPGYTNR